MRTHPCGMAVIGLLCLAFAARTQPAGVPPYVAPGAEGPVAVLLDEEIEPLFPLLNNAGGGESGTVAREERDVFAGIESVRVTPLQKYQPNIPGWSFKIVETPKEKGEFRHVRFAWKKFGGSGVMVQLHDSDKQGWGLRYHAGGNAPGWQSKLVSEKSPAEWQIVTRDLFKDFGVVTITGLALTAMDGESALFDHVLLGRSVADLDRETDVALGRSKAASALLGKAREAAWADLQGADRKKAAAALRTFLATASEHIGFISEKLPRPDPAIQSRIRKLITDFDAHAFATRQKATEDLIAIGAPALPAVREAAHSSDPEVQYRAEKVLKSLADSGAGSGTASRIVRILERAETPAAKDLLKRLVAGDFGAEYSADAKLALTRLRVQ